MKVFILIPAYNEETRIGKVVSEALQFGDIVVVDDGSVDQTREVAASNGAHVIRDEVNLGKGSAIRTGFKYFLKGEWDGLILMDADGQHDPHEIPRFLEVAQDASMMMVVGNRMDQVLNMPLVRKITNGVMSYILSKLVEVWVPDTQCGFRFLRRALIEKMNLKSSRFDIESEIFIEACRYTKRIKSVSISSIYGAEKSKIKPVQDTVRFFKLMYRSIRARR